MAIEDFVRALEGRLSPGSRILKDKTSAEFVASMRRWSDLHVRTPSAVVQPASEQDVVHTVRDAVASGIPLVPVAGGHSTWSTIGEEGIVVDLSRYRGVTVDPAVCLATVRGGTLAKELQTALHPHKLFTAVGSSGSVGVIPYYIGGGVSSYTPMIGYACENIVAARLIDGRGELVEVSETENPELLWAVRGAGQFLGLVTELTIRAHPYSLLGNEEGRRMCGTYVFLPQQMDAVWRALQQIIKAGRHASAGHFMIVQAPPDMTQQVLVVAPQVFCTPEEATELLRPLVDAGPIHHGLVPSTFATHSDSLDWMSAKGEFKSFSQIGLRSWSIDRFKKLLGLHAELIAKCPGAVRSGYTMEWHTPCRAKRELRSSFGHEDVDDWLNVLMWDTDPMTRTYLESMDYKAHAMMRAGVPEDDYISYTNASRNDPLEQRYKGADRVARLRALKMQYDPAGIFTRQLL